MVLSVSVIASVITAFVIIIGREEQSKNTIVQKDFNNPFSAEEQVVPRAIVLSDLYLPKQESQFSLRNLKEFREPHLPWSKIETDLYWIDPRDVGKDYLEKDFDEQWQNYLNAIP
ncbi:hypothetical protein [Spirochaeta cellobiosiphila]|uniref:hypothetical protein n=1 Tax=Spirochaeta cellobiosiphila TaxID=504483 RepID=UPI00040EFCBF|nr:hypothetical protein [Spirochaeta cellobiosiphila]